MLTARPVNAKASAFALASVLTGACADDHDSARCVEHERSPTEEDVIYDETLDAVAHGLAGTYVGSLTWKGGVERAFDVAPSTGTPALDVTVDLERVFVIERERVGDPTARLACGRSYAAEVVLTLSTSDGGLDTTWKEVGFFGPDGLKVMSKLPLSGPGTPAVSFAHPEFWDSISVTAQLVVAPRGRGLQGNIDVVWTEEKTGSYAEIATFEGAPQ